jgi:hypothetical protein
MKNRSISPEQEAQVARAKARLRNALQTLAVARNLADGAKASRDHRHDSQTDGDRPVHAKALQRKSQPS